MINRREFLYANAQTVPLLQNTHHNFALGQTMRVFSSSACFSWIPKNACSTMRFSIAKANGCVSDLSDINWIHPNNKSFNATTETAFMSDYTFVILRCPYQRLFSAFMDKFVNMDIQAWLLSNSRNRSFHPHNLTFRTLLAELRKIPPRGYDIHLRMQSHFLLFKQYDDYFRFEDFNQMAQIVEAKAGLKIIDTRDVLQHDTTSLRLATDFESPMDISAAALLEQRRKGVIPDPRTMFDAQIAREVKAMYADDFDLYEQKFGKSDMMQFCDAREV